MSRDLELAIEVAQAAAVVHRAGRTGTLEIRSKSTAIDLVTQVDLQAEAAVRALLHEHVPLDRVLGEEEGGASTPGGRRWIVDPLDGTLNYTHGFPYYCVSIALEIDGVVEVGVVLDSARDELFCAQRGLGATRDGTPLRVSACTALNESMLATGFAYSVERMMENYVLFGAVLPRARAIRRPGAAALDLCNVAAGTLDGFWELYLGPWDVAAGTLIVREAGGLATDGEGRTARLHDRMLVATGGGIHEELLALLSS
jgi:myo-inositol-1(or 4)-monophosphatase